MIFKLFASSGSAEVQHSPRQAEVEGSTPGSIGTEKMMEKKFPQNLFFLPFLFFLHPLNSANFMYESSLQLHPSFFSLSFFLLPLLHNLHNVNGG